MTELLVLQWFKALHLITMVAWFAGIFYLPRLFVYHAESNEPSVHAQLTIMERRLLYFITPFAILTLIFGAGMLYIYGLEWLKHSGWMHIKLTLVAALCGYHIYCFKLLKQFAKGENSHSGKWFRWFNEAPVIVLFSVILLAVLKPAFGS
ncbi:MULTISPECIES: protoporphyrinogen oxidase HemJ [Gammaproteobacteria]|uniref:protoporphyrinogen oxidase HemJ n=1 Tax=Gammaproteobacteria TaxID=1236 RepID=UPI000DD0D59F|nr:MULTISPECIES: protoporphyrinogen oxidase HemJ [Gammaproteobacteria]RTE85635.1 protoporphyrinogen oxidase HemJ [Aliidiomarina sp. B3213]TCZ89604.1 protoporphyrinogen oxidase HemJ [Lysobacter sp. N42]